MLQVLSNDNCDVIFFSKVDNIITPTFEELNKFDAGEVNLTAPIHSPVGEGEVVEGGVL